MNVMISLILRSGGTINYDAKAYVVGTTSTLKDLEMVST